jgi:hypothetical protein
MNEANYASLGASKRLVDAGIVLETEAVWRKKRDKTGYYLSRKALYHRTSDAPAPSMAEVWRELPDSFIEKRTDHYYCSIMLLSAPIFPDENPTDALIDLLIWQRKEASHG